MNWKYCYLLCAVAGVLLALLAHYNGVSTGLFR
jgi:hypothetical protein